MAVQLTRSAELVQAALHFPPSDVPASGCLVPLQFQIPEDARLPHAVWHDVEGRAGRIDGTPNPAYLDPCPWGCGSTPTGTCTPLAGSAMESAPNFAVFQIQALQPVELAQFRQEGAVEAVAGRAQGRHAAGRIERYERTHTRGRERPPHVYAVLGHLELHGRRFGGQEGLAEPVTVQDLQDGAVVNPQAAIRSVHTVV